MPVPRDKPWERWPNESAKAFRAFTLYLELGPQRTLEQAGPVVYPPRSKKGRRNAVVGGLRNWCVKFQWIERACAWDNHVARFKREADEREILASRRKWADRYRRIDDQLIDLAEHCLRKAKEILDYPIKRKQGTVDGTQVTIEPANFNTGTAARLLETARALSETTRLRHGFVDLEEAPEVEIDPKPITKVEDL